MIDLYIGLAGLARSAWAKDYFPEDLPSEWHLDFLANEFECVLLAAGDMDGINASDVSAEFRFLLEAEGGSKINIKLPVEAVMGVLSDAASLPRADGVPVLSVCNAGAQDLRAWCSKSPLELVVSEWAVDTVPDPTAIRLYIEGLIPLAGEGRLVLVFSGVAAPETARQTRIIAGFMGL